MTVEEFSNNFDTLINSYRRFKDFDNTDSQDSIEFNEYEKSIFLTNAQKDLVINYYSGNNPLKQSFESSEEFRRYLNVLIKTKEYQESDKITTGIGVSNNSIFYKLPNDLAFITFEQIIFKDASLKCYNQRRTLVYPITQDEYNKVKDNPFRGPSKYKVLRLDYDDNTVEIVSNNIIGKYIIKYLSNPEPIILEDLPNGLKIENIGTKTECKLNPILHNVILENAVRYALTTKGYNIKE